MSRAPRITLLGHAALAVVASVVLIMTAGSLLVTASQAARTDGASRLPWKLAYDHYDQIIGECCAGIDVVTSARRRPRSLVRRSRGSETYYMAPLWSPDGSRIAFIGGEALWVADADGEGSHRVTDVHPKGFLWSPDGSRLALVVGRGRVDVVGSAGDGRRTLFRLPAASEVDLHDWSADGERILVLVRTKTVDRLYSIEVQSRQHRILARAPRGRLGGASWSSDGRLVAFTRHCREDRHDDVYCDLAVMNANGSSKRTVIEQSSTRLHGPTSDAPVWIPNSSRLIVPEWGFQADTRNVDAKTGKSRRIARVPWVTPTPARDGSLIAYFDHRETLVFATPNGRIVSKELLPSAIDVPFSDLWVG